MITTHQQAKAAIQARKDLTPAQVKAANGLIAKGSYAAVEIYLNRYCPVKPAPAQPAANSTTAKPPAASATMPSAPARASYADIYSMLVVTNRLQLSAKPKLTTPGPVAYASAEGAKQQVSRQIKSLNLPAAEEARALDLLEQDKHATLADYLKPLTQ